MPDARVAPALDGATGGQVADNQQPGSGTWGMIRGLLIRCLIIYLVSWMFRRPSSVTPPVGPAGVKLPPAANLFPDGTHFDMYVYLSENELKPNMKNSEELVWLKKGLVYGDWKSGPSGDGSYEKELNITTSPQLRNNGSIYLHIYLIKDGSDPFGPETVKRTKKLNLHKKRNIKKTLNLITGESEMSKDDQLKSQKDIKFEILSHWHPNLTVNLVHDHTPWQRGRVPQPLDQFIDFEPVSGRYFPILYLNDYWNLKRDYEPINGTTLYLPLRLTYSPISMFKWQMYTAQMMKNQWMNVLGDSTEMDDDDDQDKIKEAFLETSPILLGLTVVVSLTHTVFEFMAFKNDIQFWKSRDNLEGLSVRSVFFNVFQSLVVLLYVLDNDTNTVVRLSVFVGLLIEGWKVMKVCDVSVDWSHRSYRVLPFTLRIKEKVSYSESPTKTYDRMAFKYLGWLCFPLLLGYAVYSLIYQEHKGWYSFILNMVYGFLLTFGFIMMTPQLFINYKLKSVAHLPWRQLTYKFLNTIIDDIFAFVIKMPTLYRIGCFRDDIIFIVFLYQRWIYRVDPTRVNEFGLSKEDLDRAKEGSVAQPSQPLPIEGAEEPTSEKKKDK